VAWSTGAACIRCGLPFASGPSHPCSRCLEHPPRFDRARAIVRYVVRAEGDDPIGRALRAFKYGRRRGIGGFLARLLVERFPYAPDEHDLLVAVPLDLSRLRERGFNQALVVARGVARALGSTLEPRALERVRATRSQVELDETERRANLRGAIRVRRAESVRDRRVLLVDDVLTTGATADACADALRRAGAASIDVLAVARAPLR
jgi:ComF family protein